MKFINGFTWLLIFQLIGEVIARGLSLSIPGPVIGMLLLFISLCVIKDKEALQIGASTLLKHLSLLFIPAGVGLMVYFERIGDDWLPIITAIIVGVAITMLCTAWLMMGSQYMALKLQGAFQKVAAIAPTSKNNKPETDKSHKENNNE